MPDSPEKSPTPEEEVLELSEAVEDELRDEAGGDSGDLDLNFEQEIEELFAEDLDKAETGSEEQAVVLDDLAAGEPEAEQPGADADQEEPPLLLDDVVEQGPDLDLGLPDAEESGTGGEVDVEGLDEIIADMGQAKAPAPEAEDVVELAQAVEDLEAEEAEGPAIEEPLLAEGPADEEALDLLEGAEIDVSEIMPPEGAVIDEAEALERFSERIGVLEAKVAELEQALRDEVARLVPAEAARIIREEIERLASEIKD
ncbi:MAG: hypothetical protein JW718_01420 [Desulfovibrionaceae bacterium]|nr:hypothetical protein [Desulfovibrionaceae bacterium]